MNSAAAFRLVEKAEDIKRKIALKRQKAYFRPFFNVKKVWAAIAVEYATDFSIELDRLVREYQKEVLEAITGKVLFASSKEVVSVEKADKLKKAKKYKTHEYLDERYNRVVVPDIKDTLETLKNSFGDRLKASYQKYITKGNIRDSAELVYKNVGIEFNFNKFNPKVSKYLAEKAIKWSKAVAEDTERAVKSALVSGHGKGLSFYDIAENIRHSTGFSYGRSEAIARTEIISSCNYVDYMALWDNPVVVGRKWVAANDGRTRPTHREAKGQKRKKEEPFDVGGYKLLYPGDSSLGAPASEIIKCRCTTLEIYKGEGLDSDTVYDQEDCGTEEWLRRQAVEFQESYLGGKAKQRLFQSGSFDMGDRETSTDEVIKELLKKSQKNLIKIPSINPLEADKKEYYSKVLEGVWEVQHRGIRRNKEYARVLEYATGAAATGKALKNIIAGPDDEYAVKFTPEQLKELNEEKDTYIMIHNHPDSITFSFADLVFFHRNKGLKSMIVVGHDGAVYYLSGRGRIKGLPQNKEERETYIKKIDEVILQKTRDIYALKYGKDKKIIAENFKIVYNGIVRDTIKSLGFIYSYEEGF